MTINKGILYALTAAALFGASTPLAKMLIGQVTPVMLAGLLYLGSGLGLATWMFLRRLWNNDERADLTRSDLPWLAGAILSGGIAGPVLLMVGLTLTPASSASLLLNMEGVLTALLAWFVFHEHFDRRIAFGMFLIVLAGLILSWEQGTELGVPIGALAIVGACLCWAIDNNLTRKVAASDAVQIACLKGLVAGVVNLALAFALGARLPPAASVAAAAAIGLCGYGLSLVLFVVALRQLGTARTGAYFSAAPFAGAMISIILLRDPVSLAFCIAAALMAFGIWLHLTERHAHAHLHEPMEHTHAHVHDAHHQHTHDFDWDGIEPHAHPHQHQGLAHTHAHFPDIHHRHTH